MGEFDDTMENMIITLNIYNDDYKAAIISTIGATIFIFSILEAFDGSATFDNEAAWVAMLVDDHGTKHKGFNECWKKYTEELIALAKG